MSKNRIFTIIILLISLALLIPGVTQPILSISGTIEKSELTKAGIDQLATSLGDNSANGSTMGMLSMFSDMLGLNDIKGEVEVFQKTRSIWGTVEELFTSGNAPVATLVMLFSIIIPVLKLSLMLLQQLPITVSFRQKIIRFTALISKWSMADVFVVALIVTYMAGNASAGMGELLKTTANFEVGFYYFTGYCLFSIFSTYLVKTRMEEPELIQARSEEV
ncbi:paraquat-inducible protein A [Shewanella sp. D64]|uniref:paraquat-inducible protein A n=1 Tax=unclassified Shewanella TaxID=196818 RepID=UPI0022BA2E2E|nr:MULTISPECIES: paraquat-inducible protein A [unclassified Shewanella]MEC4727569.1 paraquat-inducible protein A [Shewanella sp. D64]MEC4739820.1 paraquat-inducible protein A [Shewanella sp. E94]WBJ95793.1 paraquat-inducible protein A [Shewanella sp. MTB7]